MKSSMIGIDETMSSGGRSYLGEHMSTAVVPLKSTGNVAKKGVGMGGYIEGAGTNMGFPTILRVQ